MTGVYLAFAAGFLLSGYMLGHWNRSRQHDVQVLEATRLALWIEQQRTEEEIRKNWMRAYATGRDVERRCAFPRVTELPLDALLNGSVPQMLRDEGIL